MKTVKVHGIQRSGNNYLLRLLIDNYYVQWIGNEVAHTHKPINPKMQVDYLFIIVKHPVAWLPSICRYKKKEKDMTEIIDWNFRYSGWLKAAERFNSFIIRYEDLLKNPEKELDKAGMPKIGNFINPQNKMGKQMDVTDKSFDPDYYLKQRYLHEYGVGEIRQVWDAVDHQLLKRLGYGC